MWLIFCTRCAHFPYFCTTCTQHTSYVHLITNKYQCLEGLMINDLKKNSYSHDLHMQWPTELTVRVKSHVMWGASGATISPTKNISLTCRACCEFGIDSCFNWWGRPPTNPHTWTPEPANVCDYINVALARDLLSARHQDQSEYPPSFYSVGTRNSLPRSGNKLTTENYLRLRLICIELSPIPLHTFITQCLRTGTNLAFEWLVNLL
jgi:hypothetical protein